jgi:hypothetical protein
MSSFPWRYCILFCLGITVVGAGCVRHVPPVEPVPAAVRTYVDLQPGWRIRVVTPVLRSGKYMADLRAMPSSAGAIGLSAGDDFVGYETSFYRVSPTAQSDLSIEFVSSTVTIEGKVSQKQQPIVRLFQMPAAARHARLVFLTRVSGADHNQAILAAAELDELDRLTKLVEADPTTNCRSQDNSYCEWVPEGIAVSAEKLDPAHRRNWIPASWPPAKSARD